MDRPMKCFSLLSLVVVLTFAYFNNKVKIITLEHTKKIDYMQVTHGVLLTNANLTIDKHTSDSHSRRGVHHQTNKTFKLLPWTDVDFQFSTERGNGWSVFQNCTFSNCEIIYNKALLYACDGVIMYLPKLRKDLKALLPKRHPPWQKWIGFNVESPAFYFRWPFEQFNGIFNVSVTYRSTSTIHLPYGYVNRKSVLDNTTKWTNIAKRKTKLVAWFVSRCRQSSLRDKYVRDLQQYIPVDVYGRCGNLTCPRGNILDAGNPCYSNLESQYKFYLSFENALCKEYVTEKVFKILQLNVVPVVLGAADYRNTLPPNSYVDVRNFTSPKHLANYLLLLDSNDELYNAYFHWKKQFTVRHHKPHDYLCPLCKYMNEYANVTNTIEPFGWSAKTDCYDPSDFYKNVWNTTAL